ncbi:IDEAL domain-containing protein [Paenibacillus monticola]|nr:IDEAL domain-containing protein [Paenibacillus monticola]
MFINLGLLMQMKYELILSIHADVVWEHSIRCFNETRLRKLIDQALDERDVASFYRYSAELVDLRKG